MGRLAAFGIMCKAPVPGRTKTRLAAAIGPEQAAELSACFLRDIAATIEAIPDRVGRKGYGVYAPAGAEAALRTILPPSFGLMLQADAEFGRVLYGAVQGLLAAGHDCVMLVNSDGPTLPVSYLVEAIALLRRPDDRMVLGPAADGGYYLIGLKAAHARLFRDIPWGTDAVARLTLERASEIGLEAVLLPEWYDVDDAESLGWLRQELAGRSERFRRGGPAPATRAFLGAAAEAVGRW
jgi:rSAM/selenodomain-associated transferase 1